MRKVLIVFIVFIFQINTNAQIVGKILSNKTPQKVEFASVFLKNNLERGFADENGLFYLDTTNLSLDDSLMFSAIGYETKEVRIKDFIREKVVVMQEKTYVLPEFQLWSGKTKTLIFGNKVKNIDGKAYLSAGFQQAIKISTKGSNAKILSVNYYIDSIVTEGAKFRAILYSVDSNGLPDRELLHKSIIIEPKEQRCYTKIDLSKFQLFTNGNDFYVALEWLPNLENKSCIIRKGNIKMKVDGIILGLKSFKGNRAKSWVKNYLTQKWELVKVGENSYNSLEPAIFVELEMLKK